MMPWQPCSVCPDRERNCRYSACPDSRTRVGQPGWVTAGVRKRQLFSTGAVVPSVALVALAVYLAILPLDHGDNFCGNVFVPRGHNSGFNGCADRIMEQRVASIAIVTLAVALTVLSRLLRRGRS